MKRVYIIFCVSHDYRDIVLINTSRKTAEQNYDNLIQAVKDGREYRDADGNPLKGEEVAKEFTELLKDEKTIKANRMNVNGQIHLYTLEQYTLNNFKIL